MKKYIFIACLLGVIIILGMDTGTAQIEGQPPVIGVRVNDDIYCNDHYLRCMEMEPNIYECNGYEYGCSGGYAHVNTGTVHIYGGYAYFGYYITYPIFDYGSLCQNWAQIDLGTRTGTVLWQYVYESAGVLNSIGGSSPCTLVIGGNPNPVIDSPDPNQIDGR